MKKENIESKKVEIKKVKSKKKTTKKRNIKLDIESPSSFKKVNKLLTTRVNNLKKKNKEASLMFEGLENGSNSFLRVKRTENTNFEKIIPGYYHRMTEAGKYSNGSGCGNEMASEKPMYRKFVVDSGKSWCETYNISGFRFDLMKLLDTGT